MTPANARRSNLNFSMDKIAHIYIMTNRGNRVLYTGVTSDLLKCAYQHRHGTVPGFTSRYRTHKLVYFEVCGDIRHAILREKQIKGGSRADKIALIEKINPDWRDLADDFY
ncbi:MAG TPA: GIY-YIG nuclease family protein [Candidatus Acidoferrum sp.]|nr:GIY-YIG nuclease family protein [Candidatus Acidoferrum sp.]